MGKDIKTTMIFAGFLIGFLRAVLISFFPLKIIVTVLETFYDFIFNFIVEPNLALMPFRRKMVPLNLIRPSTRLK